MTTPFTLMLAADCKDLSKLPAGTYHVSIKYDGIRAIMWEDKDGLPTLFSRTGKVIPQSTHVWHWLAKELPYGTEVELLLVKSTIRGDEVMPFNDVQSFWMSKERVVLDKCIRPFYRVLGMYGDNLMKQSSTVFTLPSDLRRLEGYVEMTRSAEQEGIMLVKEIHPRQVYYKHGRSTLKEGFLIKYKFKQDREFWVTDFEEEVDKNGNPKGTLGALVCTTGLQKTFKVGTGFTAAQRRQIWDDRLDYYKAYVTVEFMGLSKDGIPRHPVFKGFRDGY